MFGFPFFLFLSFYFCCLFFCLLSCTFSGVVLFVVVAFRVFLFLGFVLLLRCLFTAARCKIFLFACQKILSIFVPSSSSSQSLQLLRCCQCCSLLLLLVFSVIAVAFCVMRPASCVGSFATSTTFDVVAYNECRPPTMPPFLHPSSPSLFGAVRLRLDESTATIFYAIDRNEQTHETKQKRKTKKIRKAVQEEGGAGGVG